MENEFSEEPVLEEAPQEEVFEEEAPVEEAEYSEEQEYSGEEQEEGQESSQEDEKPFTVTINGKEHSLTLEQAREFVKTGYEVEEKVKQADQIKDVMFQFLDELRTDPMSALSDPRFGIDLREFAENYLASHYKKAIDEETLSPVEKELRDLKESRAKETQQAEKQRQEAQRQLELQVAEEFKQKEIDFFGNQLVPELVKSGLPKTPELLGRVADLRQRTVDKGLDLPPAVIVQKVKEQYMKEMQTVLEGLEGEALYELLGDKTASKFRKADVSRFKNKGVVPNPTQRTTSTTTKKAAKPVSFDSFWDQLDKAANKRNR